MYSGDCRYHDSHRKVIAVRERTKPMYSGDRRYLTVTGKAFVTPPADDTVIVSPTAGTTGDLLAVTTHLPNLSVWPEPIRAPVLASLTVIVCKGVRAVLVPLMVQAAV